MNKNEEKIINKDQDKSLTCNEKDNKRKKKNRCDLSYINSGTSAWCNGLQDCLAKRVMTKK